MFARVAFAAAVLVGLAQWTSDANAELSVNFFVRATHYDGQPHYSGTVYTVAPGGSDPEFSTCIVASLDQQYTTGTGGAVNPPVFTSYDEFLSSLQQPWTITLDQGLITERNYTMTLNLGELPTLSLIPPVIDFPVHNATIDTLTPTFLLTSQFGVLADLHKFPPADGSSIIVARDFVPVGTSHWSPPVTLDYDSKYYLDIYNFNIDVSGFGFTVPVDAENVPVENWASFSSAQVETAIFFYTPVPEPGTFSGGICAALLLLGGRCFGRRTLRMRQLTDSVEVVSP